MRRHIANVLVISLAAGCGTKTPASEGAAAAPAPAAAPAAAVGQPSRSTSRDVITRAEIEQVGANTVYDVVNRLRPNFLRVEGRSSMGQVTQAPLVRLDASTLGEIDAMRSLDANSVQEIRYYSIVEAESRFSGVRGRPVIHIISRKLSGT
jgi:hypothetical protein